MNAIITETAQEVLGKKRRSNKPWITNDLLDLCDKRKELKNKKGKSDKYKQIKENIRSGVINVHENWMEGTCKETEDSLKRNDSK